MRLLDTVFKELDIRDYKLYPLATLNYILNTLGIRNLTRASFNSDFIARNVNNGKLVLPPKPAFAHHRLTGAQIMGIVIAFAPGGSGKWSYKDEETNDLSRERDAKKNESEGVGQQNNDSCSTPLS